MKFPRVVQDAIGELSRLPGMGERSAARIVFWLLMRPKDQIKRLADSLAALSDSAVICSVCGNVSDRDPCEMCMDDERDDTVLCVVQQVSDMLSIERAGAFMGRYHILGGVIDPMNDVHPEDLNIDSLIERLKTGKFREVILATDPNAEGNITANYLKSKILPLGNNLPHGSNLPHGVAITRPAQGMSYGCGISYANERSLRDAFANRLTDEG